MSGFINVYIYVFTLVTVYIYTIIVTVYLMILIFFSLTCHSHHTLSTHHHHHHHNPLQRLIIQTQNLPKINPKSTKTIKKTHPKPNLKSTPNQTQPKIQINLKKHHVQIRWSYCHSYWYGLALVCECVGLKWERGRELGGAGAVRWERPIWDKRKRCINENNNSKEK